MGIPQLELRTVRMINNANMRLAELRNLLAIVYTQKQTPLVSEESIKELEKRITDMEDYPEFAGKHEHQKI